MPEPKCNIYKHKCELIVPEGYHKCFHCSGNGAFLISTHFKHKYITIRQCPTCKGEGVVDWLTFMRKTEGFIFGYIYENFSIYCPRNKRCKVIKRWAKNIERKYDEIQNFATNKG